VRGVFAKLLSAILTEEDMEERTGILVCRNHTNNTNIVEPTLLTLAGQQ